MIFSQANIDVDNILLGDFERNSKSALMRDIFYKILRLAKMDSHIVVVGEIGSGKRRLAHIIHKNSKRAHGPFHSFYCIDVDEDDYKDAFWGRLRLETDQITLRYDALEKSSDGILYLDQFSELTPHFMSNILDSYTKGCTQLFRYNKKAQPRLIISLNQESYHKIVHGVVWKRILKELDPVVIMLPPLRERKEDIPPLIEHFLNEIKKTDADFKNLKISDKALFECSNYNWPGNIRQLKNAILQGAILSYGKTIKSEHLPFSMSWELPYEISEKDTSS